MNQLDQLKTMTTIVADTGDIEAVKKYLPTDATTNPSLILAAASQEEYQFLIDEAIQKTLALGLDSTQVLRCLLDQVCVNFGIEILKMIPGRISTEIDPRLSFDSQKSVQKAKEIISLYEKAGIDRSRILIKLASTWEGIQAAAALEKEGIHCNMTLIFSLAQAIACADAKATLISPFVGRILDWHQTHTKKSYLPHEDPGVLSVKTIYNYYKKFHIKTEIMAASFRNCDEITELSGCDLLTIAPKFLEILSQVESQVPRQLSIESSQNMDIKLVKMDEALFRWMMCEDAMASDKLYQGIRGFTSDILKLETLLTQKMQSAS
ncbi:MAG: transaldolase [Candidatus Rhabdochlamydia sp.]